MDYDGHTSLSGAAAVRWFASLGWEVREAKTPLHVVADFLSADGFFLGRLNHTPARLVALPQPPASIGIMGTIGLSGGLDIVNRSREFHLAPGAIAVHSTAHLMEIRTQKPTVRISIGTRVERLPLVSGASVINNVVSPERPLNAAFIAAASAVLDNPIESSHPSFPSMRRGLEHLLTAAINSSEVVLPGVTALSQAKLLRRALARIDARIKDPNLTVAELASDLNVSSTHLHRTFSITGQTVGQHIRYLRTILALSHIRGPQPRDAELARVAGLTGFSSARSLRRALANHPDGAAILSPELLNSTGTFTPLRIDDASN